MVNHKILEFGKKGNPICDLADYARKRKSEIGSENVFDFSMGNPSVPSPQIVTDSLIEILNTMEPTEIHSYTTEAGYEYVRKDITNYLNNTYHTSLDHNLMYLTVGASSALAITLKALLNEGDEVILIAPYFPDYVGYIENANAKIVTVYSHPLTFAPNLEELRNKITSRTKVVLINYPNNPSGAIITNDEMKQMSSILREKEQEYNHPIYLFSDEPYRELVFDNEFVPYITNYYDNSLVSYSFSKSLSLPGERIGFIVVNPNCVDANDVYTSIVGSGRAFGYVCAPSLFQHLIPKCLGITSDFSIYKENRDILYKVLIEYGYELSLPKGAFYFFIKSLDENAFDFVERAKEYEIIMVPGDSFGYPGYVRVSFCVSKDTIINSLPAFRKLIESYK